MKFSILTVGDEICIGQVINTNVAWIADKLTSIGYSVFLHSTVPDESEIMKSELDRLINYSDVIVITGGLGPTHDDITKSVLIDYFDDSLVTDKETEKYLESWFAARKRPISEVNKAQALVPSKCTPLKNRVGTAPGLLFDYNGKIIVSLPGVPAEMKYIMEKEFLPVAINYFIQFSKEVQLYLTIKTVGIFESNLAELIGSKDNFPNGATLAYLPSAGTVRLRIGAKSDSHVNAAEILNKMKSFVISKAEKYIIGYGDDTLQSLIGKQLTGRKLTLAVAESCTGGMLGSAFTDTTGSSAYFKGGVIAYSNEIKTSILRIDKNIIDSYGAVSEQTAREMALNVRQIFGTDYGVSITGIAGPDGGSEEKPVGTIWIGISDSEVTNAYHYIFGNERSLNRERGVSKALELLRTRVNML